MQLLPKTNFFQSLNRSLFPFFLPDPRNSQCQLHIGKHRLMWNQIITLKYKTNCMIPIGIPVSVFIFFRRNPVDDQITTIVPIQSTDDVKKRRLSLSCQVISKKNIEFTQKERLPISAIFHNSLS